MRLLRTCHLRDGTLSSSLLDLFNDFFSAVSSAGEFVLDLALHCIDLLLLVILEAFNLLLMFLIVSLCFLLGIVFQGCSASHLVFKFGLLCVEFFLGLFNLALDSLLHLLDMGLGLFLDGVKLLNEALFGIRMLLGSLSHNFLLLSSLL